MNYFFTVEILCYKINHKQSGCIEKYSMVSNNKVHFLLERSKEIAVARLHEICRILPRVTQVVLFTLGNILQISCNCEFLAPYKKWTLVMDEISVTGITYGYNIKNYILLINFFEKKYQNK